MNSPSSRDMRQRRTRVRPPDSSRGPDGPAVLEPPKSSWLAVLLWVALVSVLVGSCILVGIHLFEAHTREPYRSE
ncbi:hypothetical protein MRX96_027509 [Rhipicephalus microplus]